MNDRGTFLGRIFKEVINDPKKRKSWQSGVGITIFTLFVLSSVVVNESVQALNQAAGNYGYYSGSYGYGGSSNSSRATSDAPPSAPTGLSTSSITSTTATVSWTAPTTTTEGTLIAAATGGAANGSIGRYLINYHTSTLTDCAGGTSTESTGVSIALTGLTANTAYSFAVCAEDNNLNNSAALIGSFTTAAASGGTAAAASGGGGAGPTGPTFPTAAPAAATTGATPVATIVAPTTSVSVVKDATALAQAVGVARNTASEVQNTAKVGSSASEFKVTLGAEVSTVASNFVTYGTTNAAVKALGSGERLAVVRDMLETLGTTVANDAVKFLLAAEQISNGQKPTVRNLAKEVAQAGVARDKYWKLLTGKSAPDFKIAKEDLAWNTMLYRIRFKRDLTKERAGIGKFKTIFKRDPKSPLDWATVRAWGYSLQ